MFLVWYNMLPEGYIMPAKKSVNKGKQELIKKSYEFCLRLLNDELTPADQETLKEKTAVARLFIQKDIKEMSEEDKEKLEMLEKAKAFIEGNPKSYVEKVEQYVKKSN